jgi:hypothetical protein
MRDFTKLILLKDPVATFWFWVKRVAPPTA